jgi:hypothetical protein
MSNVFGETIDGSPTGRPYELVRVFESSRIRVLENVFAHVAIGEEYPSRAIYITDDESDYVTISRNSFYDIHGVGIDLFINWGLPGANVVDVIDGVYGPGPNEEIDPCACEGVESYIDGDESWTRATFSCMPGNIVEVYSGYQSDITGGPWECSEEGYGNVYAGRTYVGNAIEVIPGLYEFTVSPALPPDLVLTSLETNENGSTSEFACACITPVPLSAEGSEVAVEEIRLPRVLPNPTIGAVAIYYRIAEENNVEVAVYDMAGRLVRKVWEGRTSEGLHEVRWDGRDRTGRRVMPGAYVAQVTTEQGLETATIIVQH